MRFLLIDCVREFEPGRRLLAVKNVTLESPYFVDHFPGQPIFPGVLLLEAMAQACGVLLERSAWELEKRRVLPLMHGVTRARFLKIIRPGDQVLIEATPKHCHPQEAAMRAEATVEGQAVARAELELLLIDPTENPRYAHLVERQDARWHTLFELRQHP
jgi:3-hydroxyacyl-[acyl-carrier-protein] dehydratase